MGCVRNGVLVSILTLLVIGACVVPLIPSIKWAEAKYEGKTLQVSLWQICTPEGCTELGKDMKLSNITNDIKTPKGAERDGAVAGLILGGLFAVLSYLPMCCKSKGPVIILQFLATACIVATAICMYEYKTDSLDKSLGDDHKYKYTDGFFVACTGAVLSFATFVSSCCLNFHESYESLGGNLYV